MNVGVKYLAVRKEIIENNNFNKIDEASANALLKIFFNLFALKRLEKAEALELINLLKKEETQIQKIICNKLAAFLEPLIQKSFFYNHAFISNKSPFELACNCFYVYWTFISYSNFEKRNYLPKSLDLRDSFSYFLKTMESYEYLNLSYQNFSQCNLQRANLQGAILFETNFQGANLIEANIKKADLRQAFCNDTNFSGAVLNYCKLDFGYFQKAIFYNANMRSVDLRRCYLDQADFTAAQLAFSNLQSLRLKNVNFSYALLQQANMKQMDLERAQFFYCNLTGAPFLCQNE
jgi:uncharacterized protein YjbI with pentapeptide repeats